MLLRLLRLIRLFLQGLLQDEVQDMEDLVNMKIRHFLRRPLRLFRPLCRLLRLLLYIPIVCAIFQARRLRSITILRHHFPHRLFLVHNRPLHKSPSTQTAYDISRVTNLQLGFLQRTPTTIALSVTRIPCILHHPDPATPNSFNLICHL